MAKRNNAYHVTPRSEDDRKGNWQVKKGGASRAYSTHQKKGAAVKKAKRVARKQGTGVVVHKKNGLTHYGYKCDTSGSRNKLVKS